jgi:hypothetical protein
MWREWTDDLGQHYVSESFEEWQAAMIPQRSKLLASWVGALRSVLESEPVREGRLRELHDQAAALRTLGPGTIWERPFNQMRGAFVRRDYPALRALIAELSE